MRSVVGLVLVGLGVFALAAAALTRFYIAPQMVVAPKEYYKITRLQAQNATYFDASKLQQRTGATLSVVSTVRSDTDAADDAPGNTAVWDTTMVIEDVAAKYNVNIVKQRLAFDRKSGELTRCCGTHVDDDRNVAMSGIGLFWPLKMERKTYQYWDTSTRRAWPMKYSGTETVSGKEAWKFVQTVPATQVPSPTNQLPARLLGLPGDGSVQVQRWHQATVTWWIDPRNGIPLDQRQQVRVTMRPQSGGPGELVLTEMDVRVTPESKAAFADYADDKAADIRNIEIVIPVGLLVFGLGLTVAGAALARGGSQARHRRQDAAPTPEAVRTG